MAYIEKKSKKSLKTKKEKITYKLSINTIINLLKYTYSNSDYLLAKSYKNLKRFIDSIDENRSYTEDDGNVIEYFRVLKEVLNIIDELDEIPYGSEMIDYISEKYPEEKVSYNTLQTIFESEMLEGDMPDNNIQYWNKFIQDKLDHFSMFNNLDKLQDVIDAFKLPNTSIDPNNVIPLARETITTLYRELQANKSPEQSKLNIFNPMSDNVNKVVKTSLDSFLNTGSKLTTGYQGFDKMIKGGLQNGRCYLLVGIPKHFKSGVIVNISLNTCCYAKNWITKNPDAIPCVVYYTMENSLNETLERVYNYFGIPFNFKYDIVKNKNGFETKKYKLTDEEVQMVINRIQKESYEKTGICYIIVYDNKRTTDTSAMYTLYDELLAQGFEMIMLAHDYIKKIRSVQPAVDIRQELGNVVDEFCTFAKDKDIPVITIHQFNREAMKKAEEEAKGGLRKDLGRKLNASMVGDSNLVLENADVSIAVDKEFDVETNQNYETFHILMARIKTDPLFDYMAQPFDPDPKYDGFRIAVDVDRKTPLYITKISKLPDAGERQSIDSSNDAVKKRLGNKSGLNKSKELEEENEDAEMEEEDLAEINELLEDDDDSDFEE